MHVEPLTDPAAFLREAADVLAADPVVATIPATLAQRYVDHPAAQRADDWFAVVHEAGRAVGVAMRTAPFAPHPVNLTPMPDPAARAVAQWLRERGEDVDAVSGDEQAVAAFAAELGGPVRVVERTRLWEVRELVVPRPAPGRLRVATRDDLALTTAWYAAFHTEAAEQAGHDAVHVVKPTEAEMLRRTDAGVTRLWEDADGTVVHLTQVNPPSFGVSRLGPVFTPVEQRGKGYAASAVAAICAQVLADGHRACLFTDRENPVSTALYERLGFEPVTDMCEVWLG